MNNLRSYQYRIITMCMVMFCAFGIMTTTTDAQYSISSVITSDDVAVNIDPETPEPNTDVTITLNSYTINLSNYPIQWYVNNILVQSETGADSYTVNTGPIGTRTSIRAVISVTSTGNLITKSIILSPIGADLLWEATDSYVPPFYKGKKLPSAQGEITVTAIPVTTQSLLSDQKTSVYYWNNDFNNDANASGYAKRSYTTQNDIFNKNERVGVTISSTNGTYTASKSIVIPTVSPKLVFYKRNANGKIDWNRGSTTTINTDESGTANIVVEPYYFSATQPWQLDYVWKTPTQTLGANSMGTSISMPTRGSTRLSVSVNHLSALLQTAQAQLNLTY